MNLFLLLSHDSGKRRAVNGISHGNRWMQSLETKKQNASWGVLIAWSFYDWANAAFPTIIRTFVFASFFTQSIALNPIQGTQQWGYALALSGLIVAILSPFLGAIADQEGRRKPWIAFFTLLTIISSTLLWFSKPSSEYISWTLTLLVLGNIGFSIATVFYNAMMVNLVAENYIGRLSGLAWGLGYIGGLVSLLMALFVIQNDSSWAVLNSNMAEHIRFSGPLTALWLLIFSLPLFFLVPDKTKRKISLIKAISNGTKSLFKNFLVLQHDKKILWFLLANMIYMDGLNTIFAFGGIYAASQFGFSPIEIVKLGIAMNVAAGLGSLIFSWIDDYFGSKYIICWSLSLLTLALIGLLLSETVYLFWFFGLTLSLFVGPVQAASRSFMVHITPKERMAEAFGFFALSGKVTAFLGPWVVGGITLAFSNQRIGLSSILVFLLIGLVILIPLKFSKITSEKD